MTLEALIEVALRRESLSADQLAKVVAAPRVVVERAVAEMAAQRFVHNVCDAETPVWTWVVGDVPELPAAVERLLSERPMPLEALVAATGAPSARVCAVLRALRGSGRLEDLASGDVEGIWFVPP